jgi:hypothetical protein
MIFDARRLERPAELLQIQELRTLEPPLDTNAGPSVKRCSYSEVHESCAVVIAHLAPATGLQNN